MQDARPCVGKRRLTPCPPDQIETIKIDGQNLNSDYITWNPHIGTLWVFGFNGQK